MHREKQVGFTLIELIMTILLVGIIGIGTVQFIGSTTKGVIDSAERQQVATIGWIVSEKLSREIRDALPNSVRVNSANNCVEFIPTIAGTDYVSAPVSPASASSFEVVPFPNYTNADVDNTLDRLAIYPTDTAALYSLPATGAISGLMDQITAGVTPNAITLNLAAAHTFDTESPNRRIYVIQAPVRFCFQAGLAIRFGDYGFQASIETSLPVSRSEVIVGSDIGSGRFDYSPGTLTRTGVVLATFNIVGNSGARQPISQEIQLRNVP